MTVTDAAAERLRFLRRVVDKELGHLRQTDARLFASPLTVATAQRLDGDPDLADRVEAFVSRFCRLQDMLGDKLLPAVLAAAGETPRTAMENLDRAEKLGWLASADTWSSVRRLRNMMVHEYVEDPAVLADALNSGHESVAMLAAFTESLSGMAGRLLES